MTTPLILISGYLGAGKTTLLKHILTTSKTKIAILMNEFGDVGIDTETIRGKNVAIKELLEGCVCCSLQGEFEAGVNEIIETYYPDLILVETTGIAEADNLVVGIDQDMKSIELKSVVTLVDADVMTRFPDITGSTKIQIQTADLLIINKIDLVKDTTEITKKLQELNSTATIIETDHAKVDLKTILNTKHTPKDSTIPKEDHGMESITIALNASLDKEKFIQFLHKLQNIERIKGYCTINNKHVLLNYVKGNITLTPGYGKQQLVFIGKNVQQQQQAITSALTQAFNT